LFALKPSTGAKKGQKNAVPEAKEQNIKRAIRLNESINEALRKLIRCRGDLLTMAPETLDSVDLTPDATSATNRP
jgi:hypothetical protein